MERQSCAYILAGKRNGGDSLEECTFEDYPLNLMKPPLFYYY